MRTVGRFSLVVNGEPDANGKQRQHHGSRRAQLGLRLPGRFARLVLPAEAAALVDARLEGASGGVQGPGLGQAGRLGTRPQGGGQGRGKRGGFQGFQPRRGGAGQANEDGKYACG